MHITPTDTIVDQYVAALTELMQHYADMQFAVFEADAYGNEGEMTAIIGLSDERVVASVSLTTSRGTAEWLTRLQSTCVGTELNASDGLGEVVAKADLPQC